MPSLFPSSINNIVETKENTKFTMKKSYAIDFEKGQFIKNLDGTIKVLSEFESYIQWCQLAMMTIRYKYRAYSNKFGRDIIGNSEDHNLIELELKRITQEALLVHPMTKSVDSFVFIWKSNGEVKVEYEVKSTNGKQKTLTYTEKVGDSN